MWGNTVDIVSINVLRERVGLIVTTEMSSYIAVRGGMVMSSVNTIISKCAKLQNRLVGKKKGYTRNGYTRNDLM